MSILVGGRMSRAGGRREGALERPGMEGGFSDLWYTVQVRWPVGSRSSLPSRALGSCACAWVSRGRLSQCRHTSYSAKSHGERLAMRWNPLVPVPDQCDERRWFRMP